MRECEYASEPMDLRLLVLRLVGQSRKILLITLLGVLVLGGGYYLMEVALVPTRYVATSLYQVEYRIDPITGNEYTYINGAAWNQWMGTKEFLDMLYQNLAGTEEARIDRETMKGYLSASLQMNLSMPDTRVTTQDADLSVVLAAAVERTMVDFAAVQKGIETIRVVDPAVEAYAYSEARPLNACILSAVVTLFLTLVVLVLKELGDDAVWLPVTLRKRYGLKVLGTIESAGFAENVRYLLRGAKTVGVLPVGREQVPEDVLSALRAAEVPEDAEAEAMSEDGTPRPAGPGEKSTMRLEKSLVWDALPCAELHPQVSGRIRTLDGLVLAVEAGPHMGRRLDAVLEYLHTQDCQVTAALLSHADETLLRCYYWRDGIKAFFRKNK